METYIKKAEDLDNVNNNFIPPLLDAILGDYARNVPAARDAEVLNVMATITARLGVSVVLRYQFHLVHSFLPAVAHTSNPPGVGGCLRADSFYD